MDHPMLDLGRVEDVLRTERVFDRALDAVHETDDDFDQGPYEGLSNHAPMAAEALVAMERLEAIPAFLAAYVPRLRPGREGQPIAPADRPAALGDPARGADWVATYQAMLDHESPTAVVARELPLLAEGAASAALHGVIRTGHALRALTRLDTLTRRRELAHALGHWAAHYQVLPGRPGACPVQGRDVATALRELPRVAEASRRGLISDRVREVFGLPGFVEAVESIDFDALPFDETITALVDACAHLYLSTPAGRFVYLHGITGTSMLRIIASWLDLDGRCALLRGTVHALAALHATHADDGSRLDAPVRPIELEPATAARLAAASLDDHTIKLVEAILREHAYAPRAVLLHVAQHRLTT